MYKLLLFCLTYVLIPLLVAQGAYAQPTAMKQLSLEDYQWKNRLLLVFSPAADNAAYTRQKELIRKAPEGLEERDMLVIELLSADKVHLAGEEQQELKGDALRKRFEVPQDQFAVLLVGKDGTEKYRSQKPVELQQIYNTIDQMPMRREEMRRQNKQ
ncbi:MAG: DUF4174 domain-containing protein [Hymenobacteraceae bacterium]|nr:DUF4174 domain-containing protein [Hymenobacteraceae bacterium]MDX5482632.1 DUF4174 domain-containing protein [Hymenobacteraceae bacterium]